MEAASTAMTKVGGSDIQTNKDGQRREEVNDQLVSFSPPHDGISSSSSNDNQANSAEQTEKELSVVNQSEIRSVTHTCNSKGCSIFSENIRSFFENHDSTLMDVALPVAGIAAISFSSRVVSIPLSLAFSMGLSTLNRNFLNTIIKLYQDSYAPDSSGMCSELKNVLSDFRQQLINTPSNAYELLKFGAFLAVEFPLIIYAYNTYPTDDEASSSPDLGKARTFAISFLFIFTMALYYKTNSNNDMKGDLNSKTITSEEVDLEANNELEETKDSKDNKSIYEHKSLPPLLLTVSSTLLFSGIAHGSVGVGMQLASNELEKNYERVLATVLLTMFSNLNAIKKVFVNVSVDCVHEPIHKTKEVSAKDQILSTAFQQQKHITTYSAGLVILLFILRIPSDNEKTPWLAGAEFALLKLLTQCSEWYSGDDVLNCDRLIDKKMGEQVSDGLESGEHHDASGENLASGPNSSSVGADARGEGFDKNSNEQYDPNGVNSGSSSNPSSLGTETRVGAFDDKSGEHHDASTENSGSGTNSSSKTVETSGKVVENLGLGDGSDGLDNQDNHWHDASETHSGNEENKTPS